MYYITHAHYIIARKFLSEEDADRVLYIGKKYYRLHLLRFMLTDKEGTSQYCAKCGNIANKIEKGKILGLKYERPLCYKHANDT